MTQGRETVPALVAPDASRSGLAPDALQTVALLAKTLSDVNRLRILYCIREGQKSVSAIVEELCLSQPLVSHHLKELKHSLLVNVARQGPFVYYELADPRILHVVEMVIQVANDLMSSRKMF